MTTMLLLLLVFCEILISITSSKHNFHGNKEIHIYRIDDKITSLRLSFPYFRTKGAKRF